MYAVRKVGTNELLAKGHKYGFTAAKRPEDVWMWRRKQDAKWRADNAMGCVRDVFEDGVLVREFVPYYWIKDICELEVVEVEITINVRN